MKKQDNPNLMLKAVALILAIITWFYISAEMRRQTLVPNVYSTSQK